ncbi:MAG TPA: YbaK/EbsC family protein, partial [Candidatus Woesebacteria bacterium]|nr:YbaK/EbsC family protein [Candidatus Woesebacteria bacterium]
VISSEEAAVQRGHSLAESAKCLVVDVGQELIMVVVPGDKRANLEALRTHLGVSRVSMAAKSQVEAATSLNIGSIPPFGSMFSLRTFLDEAFLNQASMYFNCGRQDRSVCLSLKDYLSVEEPQLLPLS